MSQTLTFFIFLAVVGSFVVVPTDTVIATKTKYVRDRVDTSSGDVDKDLWIICGTSEDYRSGRSSFLPCFTLMALCMRLERAGCELP